MNDYSSSAAQAASPARNNKDDVFTAECLTSDTLLLTSDGSLILLEDLAGEYGSSIEVMSLDNYGRITTSKAYDFRVSNWVHQICSITLSSGLKIRGTLDNKILTANNGWTRMEDLTFGTVVKTAIYDPRKPVPTLSMDEVVHARIEELEEATPMFDFIVENNHSLFIGSNIDEKIMLAVTFNSRDIQGNS